MDDGGTSQESTFYMRDFYMKEDTEYIWLYGAFD